MNQRSVWKATEWRSWIVIYSLIVLKDILPKKYLKHWAMFVKAVQIFLKNSISLKEVKEAKELLIRFVTYVQFYFGESAMTYNCHLMLHLIDNLLNFGPLWTNDVFQFENENRFLLNMKQSPTHIDVQICKRYTFYKSVSTFRQLFEISSRVHEFAENFNNKLKFFTCIDNTLLLGHGKHKSFDLEEQTSLRYAGQCLKYDKIIINKKRYTTKTYSESMIRDDSIIKLKNNTVGIIKSICSIDQEKKVLIFFYLINLKNKVNVSDLTINYIHLCYINYDQLLICDSEDIVEHCILYKDDKNDYLIDLPYGCFGD